MSRNTAEKGSNPTTAAGLLSESSGLPSVRAEASMHQSSAGLFRLTCQAPHCLSNHPVKAVHSGAPRPTDNPGPTPSLHLHPVSKALHHIETLLPVLERSLLPHVEMQCVLFAHTRKVKHQRKQGICHLLVHSPNPHNGQGQAQSHELRTTSEPPTRMTGSTVPGPSSPASHETPCSSDSSWYSCGMHSPLAGIPWPQVPTKSLLP